MGSNGIEPSTSRLSGVRSNHLSYEPILELRSSFFPWNEPTLLNILFKVHSKINNKSLRNCFSLERRWSSRTFRYGYLVTTSPQSLILPSTAASFLLAHRLRVSPTLMVWRAVCTRPGNVFTAVCWPAITSNSSFMKANFSLQSELRLLLWVLLNITVSLLFVIAIVVRV